MPQVTAADYYLSRLFIHEINQTLARIINSIILIGKEKLHRSLRNC